VLRDDRVVRRIWEARGMPVAAKAEAYEAKTAQAGSAVFTKPVVITFPSGSAELNPEAIATINQQILPQMEIARGMSVRLEGNTDYFGDRWSNQRLSEWRAQAILEYLVTRGMPRGRMVARGNGQSNPIASNTTPEGRAQNRRTDVLFIRSPKAVP
jgi:outer membrane protein OmpA-like peptidoglycan-associated protein